MSSPVKSTGTYLERLDIVRAFAIIGVFYYHWLVMCCGFELPEWNGLFRALDHVPLSFYVMFPLSNGWAGVPLFYVLSGFVIHLSGLSAVRKTGKLDLAGFFLRRFWRIYPVYLAAVLVCTFFAWKSREPDVVTQFVTHAFLIHNVSYKTNFGLNPSFWSLASEVQFYLVYPLLFALRRKKGLKAAALVVVAVHLIGSLWAAIVQDWNRELSMTYWLSPLITWIYWVAGAYLAERYEQKQPPLKRPLYLILGLLLLFVASSFFKPLAFARYHLAAILSFYFVDYAIHDTRPLRRYERPLLTIGLISYSMYLWHTPAITRIQWQIGKLKEPLLAAGVSKTVYLTLVMSIGSIIGFLIVCLLSYLSYRLLELPAVSLGKWLMARKNSSASG